MDIRTKHGTINPDCITAIALIKYYYPSVTINRGDMNRFELDDENTWVIGIGNNPQHKMLNFPHLPYHESITERVINALNNKFVIDDFTSKQLKKHLVYDINKYRKGGRMGDMNYISLINRYNNYYDIGNEEDFIKCLNFAIDTISNIITTALRMKTDESIWNNLDVVYEHVKLSNHDRRIMKWRKFAYSDGTILLITPSKYDEWLVISVSSNKFPLVPSKDILHLNNNKYIAIFSSKHDAIKYSINYINRIKQQ